MQTLRGVGWENSAGRTRAGIFCTCRRSALPPDILRNGSRLGTCGTDGGPAVGNRAAPVEITPVCSPCAAKTRGQLHPSLRYESLSILFWPKKRMAAKICVP